MTAIPNVADLLDKHLLAKRAAEGEREITGGRTWRASKLGYCLRQQYLEFFLKQPKIGDFNAKTLKRFEVGHTWSRQFAQWFREMGYDVTEEMELDSEDLDVGAHVDFILNNEIGIELKSVNSKTFWYRERNGETTAAAEHMIQAATYSLLMPTVPTWLVLTVSKDDLTIVQDVVTEGWRIEATRRLLILNNSVATGQLLPCTCRDDWQWQYCGYWADTKARDEWLALTPYQRKKQGKPDGDCCVVGAQEKQEALAWL